MFISVAKTYRYKGVTFDWHDYLGPIIINRHASRAQLPQRKRQTMGAVFKVAKAKHREARTIQDYLMTFYQLFIMNPFKPVRINWSVVILRISRELKGKAVSPYVLQQRILDYAQYLRFEA